MSSFGARNHDLRQKLQTNQKLRLGDSLTLAVERRSRQLEAHPIRDYA